MLPLDSKTDLYKPTDCKPSSVEKTNTSSNIDWKQEIESLVAQVKEERVVAKVALANTSHTQSFGIDPEEIKEIISRIKSRENINYSDQIEAMHELLEYYERNEKESHEEFMKSSNAPVDISKYLLRQAADIPSATNEDNILAFLAFISPTKRARHECETICDKCIDDLEIYNEKDSVLNKKISNFIVEFIFNNYESCTDNITGFADKIDKLDIQDPLKRKKLAAIFIDIFLKNNMHSEFANLNKFNAPFTDEELFNVAKRSIVKSAGEFDPAFFNIKDKVKLLELAEIASQNVTNSGLYKFIEKLEIDDPELRYKYALICAKVNPSSLIEYLPKFKIEKQEYILNLTELLFPYFTGSMYPYFKKVAPIAQYGYKSYIPVIKIIHKVVIKKLDSFSKWYIIANYLTSKGFETDKFKKVDSCNIFQFAINLKKIFKNDYIINPTSEFKPEILNWGDSIGLDFKTLLLDIETSKHFVGKDLFRKPLNKNIITENYEWLLMIVADFSTFPGWQLDSDFKLKKTIFLKALEKCALIHNPIVRREIMQYAMITLTHNEAWAFFKLENKLKSTEYSLLPQLTSCSLIGKNISIHTIRGVLDNIYSLGSAIKDRKFNDPFYRFINFCHINLNNSTDVTAFFSFIFEPTINSKSIPKQAMIQRLEYLRNIGELGGVEAIKGRIFAANKDNLDEYFLRIFRQKVPVKDRVDFIERYKEAFQNTRNPTALLQYAASLQTLIEDREESLKALATFVDNVLDGEKVFKKRRMEIEGNVHLATVFKVRPDLKTLWAREGKFSLEFLITQDEFDVANTNFDISHFLYKKLVVDKHIKTEYLAQYLKDEHDISVYNQLLLNLKTETDSKKVALLNIEKQLIELTNAAFKNLIPNDKIKRINSLIEEIKLSGLSNLIINDLKELKNNLAPVGIDIRSCMIEFSNNPIDLLLCGTDVEGSCQNVKGNPNYNRGLLGYLLDGKIKLVIVKDQDGKIIARSIARLLWDDTNHQPAMLLSRLYGMPAMEKAIITLAKERAEEMDIPLLSVEIGNRYGNSRTLKSFGGPSPSEYVDERGCVKTNGVYVVENAHYL